MSKLRKSAGKAFSAPMLLAAATLALVAPSAVLALGGVDGAGGVFGIDEITPFTPATVDPQLAQRVAEAVNARGKLVRFTPAGTATTQDRTMTVAVRVDDQTARAISVRAAIDSVAGEPGRSDVAIATTRYNLGIARGYQSFAKPEALPRGVKQIDMPDLADFEPARGVGPVKPSRFQPRLALEQDGKEGRAPRTLESLGEQSVDLGGAYRLTRNLNVTAGVRLSQDRDRIAPLTDSVQDNQAVYVGTQFRF
ncbi:MAG: hypothetical protein R3E18_08525 [Sphingomonadaceae bacterium]